MKKLLKFLLGLVVTVVVIALAAVLTLPWWISPVAKGVVNSVGPKYTQTRVNLGDFAFNFYDGSLRVGDLQVGNPAGYANEQAFTLGKLEVEVEPMSAFTETVHIRLIRISDVYVSYDFKDGRSNFDVLKENATKGGEEAKGEEQPNGEGVANGEEKAKGEKSGKKVIIDRLEIGGVMAQLGPLPMPIPPLTLTDIGKKSNGVLIGEAWDQVSAEVMKSTGVIGSGASVLGDEATKRLGKATKKLDKRLDKFSKRATKALNGAGDAVSAVGLDKAAGTTVNAATEVTGAAVDTATKTIESTGKVLKGLFK